MMKSFAQLLILILVIVPNPVDAQFAESESRLLASNFESWQMQSSTPLGDGERHRIVYTSDADTVIVWTNLDGEPRIIRAQIDGDWFARTLTAGTFSLSDSLLQAYRWMQDETFRRRLEALLDDDAVTLRNQ